MSIKEQERQKFEQWLRAQPHVLNVGFNKGTQEYVLSEDQDQWIGWQARAELSFKAEARIDELEDFIRNLWIDCNSGQRSAIDNILENK